MNSLAVRPIAVLATDLRFEGEMLRVQLSDGREVGVPLEWFPKLRNATEDQKRNWRLIGKGVGIHWEDVDEDLSMAALLGY